MRLYHVRTESSADDREKIERAALREFQILESLQHPGALRTYGFTEHAMGPALIFEHESGAMRLDHYLIERRDRLAAQERLELMRPVFVDKGERRLETLGQRLRKEGRLQLDHLQRFGKDLLEVVEHLQEQAVASAGMRCDFARSASEPSDVVIRTAKADSSIRELRHRPDTRQSHPSRVRRPQRGHLVPRRAGPGFAGSDDHRFQ